MATDEVEAQDTRPGTDGALAEPASAVIAAHFAPRLGSQGNEAHRLSRETFSQLRQELLVERNNQLRVDDGITDINKLVCIVLKAGLEVSPGGASSEEDLEGQVLDCLDIIQSSIEKAPQALWDLSDPHILAEDVQAPLFAWLVLRLIRVVSIWPSETVQNKVLRILTCIACSQCKQARSSLGPHDIAAFLCACLSGLSKPSSNLSDLRLIHSRRTMHARDLPK